MHVRDRLVVADPQVEGSTLAESAQQAGAWALVDLERPNGSTRLEALDASRTLVRVNTHRDPIPGVRMAVLAPWTLEAADVPRLREAIDAWQAQGVQAAVEVRSPKEARRARDAGADALVARGGEGPGRASSTSSLVLVPELAELGLPLIAWGGAGPSATGALLVHADLVVLDAQLYALPEAGLSDAWQRTLGAFDGGDVRALGSSLDEPFYAMARPADEHVHELWEAEQAASREQGPRTRRRRLLDRLDEARGHWSDPPSEGIHALGHDAAHAGFFQELGSLEDALDHIEARIATQAERFPLEEGSPLAEAHGTELPVVQGAMANVSEEPEFARAVADAGGLPFLAFASLREAWAEEVLEGTQEALDEDQAFGCGIIGLDLNEDKREAHMRLIREEQPDKALIAAGTVEQARELEDAGVDTYLHTPSRGLVRSAIEAGLDHVVVEGNECGGHIGKLPSLVLWDVALQEVADVGEDVRVLLAGGVSDDDTAAVAGTLAAGIEEARVGVLMGTAYLATEEIVDSGAVTEAYQRLVLASQETEVTGETVGIRARSAPTPFTERVQELEQELVREDVDLDERKQRVEDENLGATRLAARGVERDEEGTYHEVPTEQQLQDGNYLMGQGAELIEETYTIEDLHREVTDGAARVADQLGDRLSKGPKLGTRREVREDSIAIVGLGCVMPDAGDVDTFWNNVLEGHVAIQEIPEGRWPIDPDVHLADTRDVDGETYTVLGGFVDEDDVDFDPIEHRIPPNVADQMDDSQKWAVRAAGDALADAGLLDEPDRDEWAVVLGNAMGGEQRMWTSRRLVLEEAKEAIRDEVDDTVLERLEEVQGKLPEINEDTMPGELANIVASRICSVFDIGGPARTVDAACASTLAAVEDAVSLLREGKVDVALTGGVDRSMDPGTFAKFSAIGALSPEGSFPFDERASGFVMGEGAGCLVLKRLEDALEEGDRIYACIEGVGSSSDGKGKGITAPNPEGQQRAIENALEDAEVEPGEVSLVEAHGTGTPVGDPTEVQTLEAVLARDDDVGPIGLGSVKSNVGHLKAAAGAAGLIKAAKAIDEATLPPTVVQAPTSEVDWEDSPLSLVEEPLDWDEQPRLAGVSAFGFGGTNSHVVLSSPPRSQAGAREDPTEPLVVTGPSRKAVLDELEHPPGQRRRDPQDPVRVACGPDVEADTIRRALTGELPPQVALAQGVAVADLRQADGEIGLVFPGQGSQYPRMVLELAEHFPAAREVLDRADQVLTPLLGRPLTDVLELEGEEGIRALTPTEVCQPAVLAADVAILRTLEELGVEPDVVAGHSLGEYAALVAAGSISFEDALFAVSARGREMADVEVDDPGGLVALETDRAGALELIDDLDAWPANVNGPKQTVVAGTTPALETLEERADEADVRNSQLTVSAAFHSPIVEPATQPLRRVLEDIPFDPPEIPVVANATGEPYPDDPDAMRDLLAEQVASPVEWVATMEHFDQQGVDLVVEAGPGRVLSGLAQANLEDVPAVPTLHERSGETESFARARLALAAAGHTDRRPKREGPQVQSEPSTVAEPTRTTTRARSQEAKAPHKPPRTVITGVSLGVPGVEDPFSPDATQALLDGENLIDPVPEHQRERMANMGVRRLDKDAPGGPSFEHVEDPGEVVQLAGQIADVDLSAYGADEDWLEQADRTARLAVAAALEALDDATIPLVPDEHETSTGTTLQEGWSLPEPMQQETGVILASAFPGYDNLLDVVDGTRASNADPASFSRGASPDALVDAIDRLAEHIENEEGRRELMDWATQAHLEADEPSPPSRGETAGSQDEAFPRDFLFRVLGMGHAQVAQLVDARGPNLHVNAACASTTSAIALAQDWIEQGRCERVVVVGADVAGSRNLLPWIGSGFMAAGAASTASDVEDAALPFDQDRNGMLIGSGAVGLVVETASAAEDRGVTPLAELTDTRVANSAYHGARLDPDHVGREVGAFLDGLRQREGIDADELAEDLVFVSHEPATPPRGGSAEAEIEALRSGLGAHAEDVLVTNTKGLTGHAMGAGLEDGIAVELLRRRQAPPIANLDNPDPGFDEMTFSDGSRTDRSRAVRFAAGFGSQVAMACLTRISERPGDVDREAFEDWLARAVGGAEVTTRDRLLRAVPSTETEDDKPQPAGTRQAPSPPPESARRPGRAAEIPPSRSPTAQSPRDREERSSSTDAAPANADHVRELLVELVSQKTGYPVDVIEPGMDLEADLGVDTVKQAEVLSRAREELGIPPIEGMSLADVPTIDDAASLLAEHASGQTPIPADETRDPTSPAPEEQGHEHREAGTREGSAGPDVDDVRELLVELVSQKTGYPVDVIEPGMDLEADLGVDTVKQAEVLSRAREELGIPPIEGMSLADVPTIDDAASLLAEHATQPDGAREDQDTLTSTTPGTPSESKAPSDPITLTRLSSEPAPPPEGRLEPGSLETRGPVHDELENRLPRQAGQDENLVVVGVEATSDPQALADLLGQLQDVPAEARVVLLADAGKPPAGGLSALASTLTAEERPTRAIAIGDRVPVDRVVDEILADTLENVQLDANQRRRLALAPVDPDPPVEGTEPLTVLAPGGLGAAVQPCLVELARRREVQIGLVGRSPLEEPRVDPADEDDVQRLREELLEQAREEGASLTPADVEERVQREVRKARRAEAFAELDELADVRYVQADARDASQLESAVEEARSAWGDLDVVVHGVGVDRSRSFEEKTRQETELVLGAKLDPVRTLVEALPEAHHVAFGSIAGAFGNPGQADYALANGCLSDLLEPLDGTVIHWTAWDAAGGMADDDTVRQVLEERDVSFLDPERGAELFLKGYRTPGTLVASDRDPSTVLVDEPSPPRLELGGQEALLQDHQVGSRPLFPGVAYLQAMREAARRESAPVDALHEIRFEKPAWVTQPTTLAVRRQDGRLEVEQDDSVHASAREGIGPGVKPVPRKESRGESVEADRIYDRLFHGPSFQVLDGARVSDEHVTAEADLAVGGAAPWALAIEASMQAAGLAGEGLQLPIGIKALSVEAPPPRAHARVDARLVGEDATGSTWDATVRVDGEPVLHVRGIRLQRTDAQQLAAEASSQLSGEGLDVCGQPVATLDPRDPRDKRNSEHEAGNQAARRVVEQVLGEKVRLDREDGRPVVEGAEGGVSITHGHGLALAAARRGGPVGIDLERVRERSEAWQEDHLTDDEVEVLESSRLEPAVARTLAWTLKEAASKVLGTGLDRPARAYSVTQVDDGRARVSTPEGEVLARWTRLGDLVVSTAVPSTQPAGS